jgi:hypothetical protein
MEQTKERGGQDEAPRDERDTDDATKDDRHGDRERPAPTRGGSNVPDAGRDPDEGRDE